MSQTEGGPASGESDLAARPVVGWAASVPGLQAGAARTPCQRPQCFQHGTVHQPAIQPASRHGLVHRWDPTPQHTGQQPPQPIPSWSMPCLQRPWHASCLHHHQELMAMHRSLCLATWLQLSGGHLPRPPGRSMASSMAWRMRPAGNVLAREGALASSARSCGVRPYIAFQPFPRPEAPRPRLWLLWRLIPGPGQCLVEVCTGCDSHIACTTRASGHTRGRPGCAPDSDRDCSTALG